MAITDHAFKNMTDDGSELGCQLYVPDNYDADKSYPLILFLHGVKKRGEDIRLLDNYGPMKHAAANPTFPFIIVAPQCPLSMRWTDIKASVVRLRSEIIARFNVDEQNIFLTGFSIGANGVWDLAASHSELFAAAVPISGWHASKAAEQISIPVWAFHGEEDNVIPVTQSIEMVNAMKKAGGEVLFTSYPNMKHEHEVMDRTFANPELYEWLLRSGKSSKSNALTQP